MRAKFFLLLLVLSLGVPRLGAQDAPGAKDKQGPKDVPTDAKEQLKTAWGEKGQPDMCLKALRLLVTNSAHPGATTESSDEARADALVALEAAGFPSGALLNEAFRNPNFRDWLASAVFNPAKMPRQTEENSQDLVDCIYGQGDGIAKLGDVTRAKAAHPDNKDLVPLLSLLDAVPAPQPGRPNPLLPNPVPEDFPATCKASYATQLDAFRAAYALKSANWSIFDYIAEKINGSASK